MTKWIRKNIGLIVAFLGFFLLVAITFGNIVDVFTPEYWRNVYKNLASIGILSVSLTFIQTTIKQGISEQALSAGLNSIETQEKYKQHKEAMKRCEDRLAYVSYFLDNRNLRDTRRRKKEFLANNRFTSEENLFISKNKKLIRQYSAIATKIRFRDIKWTSTDVVVDKYGRVETLPIYRRKRSIKGLVIGAFSMLFVTLIARELFGGGSDTPLWVNILRIITYLITIATTVVFDILKNYEKGAFGVPNDLDEINAIWHEFEQWRIPAAIIEEVERNQLATIDKEDKTIEQKTEQEPIDSGAALQEESKEVEAA